MQIFNSLLAARGCPVASVPAWADTLAAPVRKPRLWQEVASADRQLYQVCLPPVLPYRVQVLTAAAWKGYATDGARARLAHPAVLERLHFDWGAMPSSGAPVIKCPSPLNAPKDTHDHSCC